MVYQVGRQNNGVTDARGRSMDLLVGLLSHVIHQDRETMMMRRRWYIKLGGRTMV